MLENQKQAEVLWPRLVANKLFRKTSGSHAFVADFPAADDDDDDAVFGTEFDDGGCSPDVDASRCVKRARPQERNNKTLKYKLFASTWNVGGVAPPDDLDLSDWLDGGDDGPYDMYVLGFQEVVPLRARNVLGADKKRVGMRWIELIRAALNRSHSRQRGGSSSGSGDGGGKQQQKVYPVRDGGRGELARDYRCVVSKQMVGILLTVWVRSDLRRFVRRPSVSCVGCGVMGCLGNKPGDPARGPQLQDLPAGGQDEAAGGAPGLEDAAGERPAARRGVPRRRRVPGLERGRHHLLPDLQVLPQLRRLLRLRHRHPRRRRRRPQEQQAARAGVVRPHPVARRGAQADPLRPLRVPAVGPPPRPRRLHGGGGRAQEPQLAQELLRVREVR
ncbi:type IV inositol polyphosphate 5-phosphatase 9-like isoform X2 [Miscanthus floridulus]|uniref:type IV inositol polyphosphate 5-phosphatase 9-like isoform X2 n=1 Tax=Miscanthus floridulus TaxID=154761 RepID=UPI00345AC655